MFIDKDPFIISEETGKQLKEWAESGIDPIIPVDPNIAINKNRIASLLRYLKIDMKAGAEVVTNTVKALTQLDVNVVENYEEIISRLGVILRERKENPPQDNTKNTEVDPNAYEDNPEQNESK